MTWDKTQRLLFKFLRGELSESEFVTLKNFLKKILRKALQGGFPPLTERTLHRYFGPDYEDCVVAEMLMKYWKNREYLLSLPTLNEIYVKNSIKNLLYELLSSSMSSLSFEVKLEDLSNPNSEHEMHIEEIIEGQTVDHLENIKLDYTLKRIREILTPKDLETICYYLRNKSKSGRISSKERTALYKRWERLKPKLRKILQEELEFSEDWHKLVDLLLSEICDKGSSN